MIEWVRFHRQITKGAKRGLPRSARFIFMELSLESRQNKGVVELPPGMPTVDALHDLIGGDRAEIEAALARLQSKPHEMIEVVSTDTEHRIVLPSWEVWNTVDKSTERTRKHREQKRNKKREHRERVPTVPGNKEGTEGEQNEDPQGTLLEKRREEKKREECRGADAPPARAPGPFSNDAAERIFECLKSHRSLRQAADREFAAVLATHAVGAGKAIPWVIEAIGEVAVDLTGGSYDDEHVRRKIRAYASRAKRPSVDPERQAAPVKIAIGGVSHE